MSLVFSYRLIGLKQSKRVMPQKLLSDEEIARYNRDGLVIPKYRLPQRWA